MKRTGFSIAFMCWLALAGSAWAQQDVWEIDASHSSAQFSVRHMMVSNVRGEFAKMAGRVFMEGKDISKARVEATLDANSITTRNEARDKHLRSAEFFDVANHPTIEFKSKKAEAVSSGRFRITGDLTLHGVTKEVILDAEGPTPEIKDQRGNTRVGVSATTKINRKDFNILWDNTLDSGGVVLGDEVAITIDLELIKRATSGK
jgi:polyisoprenoid-binding protein YceI